MVLADLRGEFVEDATMTAFAPVAKLILSHVAHFMGDGHLQRVQRVVPLRIDTQHMMLDLLFEIGQDVMLGLGAAGYRDGVKLHGIGLWKAPARKGWRHAQEVIGLLD